MPRCNRYAAAALVLRADCNHHLGGLMYAHARHAVARSAHAGGGGVSAWGKEEVGGGGGARDSYRPVCVGYNQGAGGSGRPVYLKVRLRVEGVWGLGLRVVYGLGLRAHAKTLQS